MNVICRRNFLRIASVMLFALSGCQTMQPAGPALKYSETIDIGGRFTTQYEQNGKPQSISGSFEWSQTPQQTTVTLLSPLGQTVATITSTPQGATLIQADRAPRSADNVDALVADTLGWPLPVSNMRSWMQGQVTDDEGHHLSATPQLTKTVDTADGWRLQYLSWQDNETGGKDSPAIPKRIDMERDTSYAGRVQMRLVISSWQPH
ncbi:MAG TPA: lipoprotein insertase outer membrane protein LolB [Burkholderiaceae bacterium]